MLLLLHYNDAMSEQRDEIRFTIRMPESLYAQIEARLKEQKKHFKVSKNSFIVGLLRAALDSNVKIGLVAENPEEAKKEREG
jgi:hypothetical protein